MDYLEVAKGKPAKLFIMDFKRKATSDLKLTVAATGQKINLKPTVKKHYAPHMTKATVPTGKQ